MRLPTGDSLMEDIRIAAVTCLSIAGDVDRNLGVTVQWTKNAHAQGASIVCFPELGLSGYCLDRSICARAAGAYEAAVYTLRQLAKDLGIVILAGTVRQDDVTGALFADHIVFAPDQPITAYTKLHIAPPEKGLFTPGDRIPVFKANGVVFGIQLCYDAHFPELSTCMAMDGADILFVPHASPRGTSKEKFESWMRHLPARAYDNGVFVVACNQSGKNGAGLDFPALAVALGPSGEVVGKETTPEGMVVTDLSKNMLNDVRSHRMRYFLPNRRPDLYARHGKS